MNADQPYPARIHVSKTEVLEVRMYTTSEGAPQPHVQHDGIDYFHTGSTSVMGGVNTYDYMVEAS